MATRVHVTAMQVRVTAMQIGATAMQVRVTASAPHEMATRPGRCDPRLSASVPSPLAGERGPLRCGFGTPDGAPAGTDGNVVARRGDASGQMRARSGDFGKESRPSAVGPRPERSVPSSAQRGRDECEAGQDFAHPVKVSDDPVHLDAHMSRSDGAVCTAAGLYIPRYLGPLPPSRGVHRGPSTSVALQSTQLGGFTLSPSPTRS
jgi:hypothetical protein